MKTLHILNGDATLHKFAGNNSPAGDVLVWREVLSEGPVSAGPSYDAFFAMRSEWISKAFKAPAAGYKQKVTDEFLRLEQASGYDEITLWFEFDLHCQVNLLFLLDHFSRKSPGFTKLSLICPASHPDHPDFRGLGELGHEELAALFPSRRILEPQTLLFAASAWKAYCTGSRESMSSFLQNNFGPLPLLKPALEAHLHRLPEKEGAMSLFEERLAAIVDRGFTDRSAIYTEFWKNNAIYGMGDAALNLYLDKLAEQKRIPFIPYG